MRLFLFIEFKRYKVIMSNCCQLGWELPTVCRQALVWVPRPGIVWAQISGFATCYLCGLRKLFNLSEPLSFTICQTGLVIVPASWFELMQLRHWIRTGTHGKHLVSRRLHYDDFNSPFLADLWEKPMLERLLTTDRRM